MADLNLYKRFTALFPAPAVEYGRVVSSSGDTVTVQLFQGGVLSVPTGEAWAAGAWVWVRRDSSGWSMSSAPALAAVEVEV